MYQHWRCTFLYWPLSYPGRSLEPKLSLLLFPSIHPGLSYKFAYFDTWHSPTQCASDLAAVGNIYDIFGYEAMLRWDSSSSPPRRQANAQRVYLKLRVKIFHKGGGGQCNHLVINAQMALRIRISSWNLAWVTLGRSISRFWAFVGAKFSNP